MGSNARCSCSGLQMSRIELFPDQRALGLATVPICVMKVPQIVIGFLPLPARDLMPEIWCSPGQVRTILVAQIDNRRLRPSRQIFEAQSVGGRAIEAIRHDPIVVRENHVIDCSLISCRDRKRMVVDEITGVLTTMSEIRCQPGDEFARKI